MNEQSFSRTAFFIGLALLLLGLKNSEGFWDNLSKYQNIYFGIGWFFISYINRLRWKNRIALQRVQQAKVLESKDPLQTPER